MVLLWSLHLLILRPPYLVSQIVGAKSITSNHGSVQPDGETGTPLRKHRFAPLGLPNGSEEQVLIAERWAALAWLDGNRYPSSELMKDWQAVLSRFDDQSASLNTARAYKEAQKSYDAVRMSTERITDSSLQTIVDGIDTQGEGIPVVVFNPLGFLRSGDVTIRAKIPYRKGYHLRLIMPHTSGYEYVLRHVSWNKQTGVAEMEANVGVVGLGYAIYRLVLEQDDVMYPGNSLPYAQQTVETSSTIHLRNQYIDVSVDRDTGCITSLLRLAPSSWPGSRIGSGTRLADVETIAPGGCGNQLQAINDDPNKDLSLNGSAGFPGQPLRMPAKADSVELIGASSPESTVRVTRTWQSSKFAQTISLKSDMVDIDNEIDWHETHARLEAAFPLAATNGHATYEIPYGTTEQSTIRDSGWGDEVHAQHWADISGPGPDGNVYGLSVINQSSSGYNAAGNVLRLTLLGSRVVPDPNVDPGRYHFRYALYPHLGTWKDAKTVFHGWEYNFPLTAVVTSNHPAPLPALDELVGVHRMDPAETVVVTSIKKADDGDALIIRLYEWAGNNSKLFLRVPPGMTGARLANMMEVPIGEWLPFYISLRTRTLEIPIHPYEVLTLRVDYPPRH